MSQARIFACDFETTVFDGQTRTDVWSSARVELGTENVIIDGCIESTYNWLLESDFDSVLYYHNLKFDGSFWLDFLCRSGLPQAYNGAEFVSDEEMPAYSYKYSISDKGQWYTIVIRHGVYYTEIRDSLKLMPMSLEAIGKSFQTKHRKLSMEYKGERYPNCPRTEEENQYIANDVLVLKEALEYCFAEGHNKLTIGSCCLEEFKKLLSDKYDDQPAWLLKKLGKPSAYRRIFPDLSQKQIDFENYGAANEDLFVRKAYHGGWCYKTSEASVCYGGTTLDVNSLYPSMMHSDSGNRYPIGYGRFWEGPNMPKWAKDKNHVYYIKFRCRFEIKEGKLPFVQIKGNWCYKRNESLTTSRIYNPNDGKYYDEFTNKQGETATSRVTLTMFYCDYELFLEHYDVYDFEILGGVYYWAEIGIFDDYINKYREIKMNSKGARRTIAKLYLNNLYGKLAASKESNYKTAYIDKHNKLNFDNHIAEEKESGYIPAGAAITAYARRFTVRAAQANYYGKGRRGFRYADTDSIHCDLSVSEIKGVMLDPVKFCCWKAESYWDIAIFTRQKTYIEHITHEDGEPVEAPYYNIKCAGMPDQCKRIFDLSLRDNWSELEKEEVFSYPQETRRYMRKKNKLTDFRVGLRVPGDLKTVRMPGGIVLMDGYYTMRPN